MEEQVLCRILLETVDLNFIMKIDGGCLQTLPHSWRGDDHTSRQLAEHASPSDGFDNAKDRTIPHVRAVILGGHL